MRIKCTGCDNKMRVRKIVLITGPGFEDVEVIYPYYRLLEEGFVVDVTTNTNDEVFGKHGIAMKPTISLVGLSAKKYDAVIIPGGLEAPDRLRQIDEVLRFIREMFQSGKIVSSICHGPWVLISAGILENKNATCYIGMKDDLKNAGAIYLRKNVVVDGNLITSDHPRNLSVWMRTTIELINK